MKKLRLSYTLLSLWERGACDDAVNTYFHVDRPTNAAMIHGKKVHDELAEYIDTHNTFPEWFFSYDLSIPECEKAVTVSYNEMFDLKGIFDCVDVATKTLFEFKTGNTNSLAWARTDQLPIYFLIAGLAKIPVEKAILIRHDGEKSDFVVVHNSKRLVNKGRNIVDSYGPEIYQYFLDQGLI